MGYCNLECIFCYSQNRGCWRSKTEASVCFTCFEERLGDNVSEWDRVDDVIKTFGINYQNTCDICGNDKSILFVGVPLCNNCYSQ